MLPEFHFVGGHQALDFANTVAWLPQGLSNDRLVSYARLLEFGRRTHLITPAESRRLALLAGRSPRRADAALARAKRIRAALHRGFAAIARNEPLDREDLKLLNSTLRKTGATISPTSSHEFLWRVGSDESLEVVTERVLWSAAQLLTSPLRSHVGICNNDECGWVFMDVTRNHSRRWCSMAECGSRAKSRTYYKRTKRKGSRRKRR